MDFQSLKSNRKKYVYGVEYEKANRDIDILPAVNHRLRRQTKKGCKQILQPFASNSTSQKFPYPKASLQNCIFQGLPNSFPTGSNYHLTIPAFQTFRQDNRIDRKIKFQFPATEAT
jgi:hypothetical protein